MKKHSLYLREDQIAFLKSLSNASTFMREALDLAISSERGSAEKTICLYEATKELETKIATQILVIETNGKETEEIEKKITRAQLHQKVAENIANGEFQVQQFRGKWRVLAPTTGDKYVIVTDGHISEEAAKTRGLEKGKIAIKNTKRAFKELEEKKQRHHQYVEAQKAKLKDMQRNLKKLYAK